MPRASTVAVGSIVEGFGEVRAIEPLTDGRLRIHFAGGSTLTCGPDRLIDASVPPAAGFDPLDYWQSM